MLYVLCGQNRYGIQEKLNEIVQKFSEEHGSSTIERRKGDDIDPNEIASILAGQSLFSSQRLILISDMIGSNRQATDKFLEVVSEIPDTTMVVLVEGELDRRTSAYKQLSKLEGFLEFKKPSPGEVSSFMASYVESHDRSITSSAKQELLTRVGSDQSRLKNELDKLINYTDEEITAEMVVKLVELGMGDQVFELLDNALRGRRQLALKILGDMEAAHQDPHQVVGMLVWQARVMAIVSSAEGRAEAQIAKEAKINPFVVTKTRALTRDMPTPRINKIIDQVAELDIKSKSSSLPLWHLIERVIIQLA